MTTCSRAARRYHHIGHETSSETSEQSPIQHVGPAGAVCDTEQVWQMTDEMLVAQAQWLPQYAPDILAARERLADHERNGTRVKLCNTKGAARLHTKSVEELARDKEDARANASAADKGKMTVAK